MIESVLCDVWKVLSGIPLCFFQFAKILFTASLLYKSSFFTISSSQHQNVPLEFPFVHKLLHFHEQMQQEVYKNYCQKANQQNHFTISENLICSPWCW